MTAGKALVAEFFEAFNANHPVGDMRRFFDDAYTHHNDMPGLPPGFEGFAQIHQGLHAAFPDLHVEVLDMIEEDGTIAARTRWSGTHRGLWMGVAPRGNALEFDAMEFWEISDGRFTAHWIVFDRASMMQQLQA